jgi:hypothetical protein
LLTEAATPKLIGKVMGVVVGRMVMDLAQENLADLNGHTAFAQFHQLL